MKKLLYSFMILLCSASAYSQNEKTAANAPQITFEKLSWNYPEITYGSDFTKDFVFTNTGKSPLIISNAQTSCGCDDVSFPKEPIMPGKTGIMRYHYDTKRVGSFSKSFTLTCNALKTPTVAITVSGKVAPQIMDQNEPEIKK